MRMKLYTSDQLLIIQTSTLDNIHKKTCLTSYLNIFASLICIILKLYLYLLSICTIFVYYLYVLSLCIIYMYHKQHKKQNKRTLTNLIIYTMKAEEYTHSEPPLKRRIFICGSKRTSPGIQTRTFGSITLHTQNLRNI